MSPMNCCVAVWTRAGGTSPAPDVGVSGDSGSSVSVVAPNFTVASYCLGSSISRSHDFVALPTSNSSTPVANGSRVPAWPILVPRGSRRFTAATARAEDIPAGLSRLMMPSMVARRAPAAPPGAGSFCVLSERTTYSNFASAFPPRPALDRGRTTRPLSRRPHRMVWDKNEILQAIKKLHRQKKDLSYNAMTRRAQPLVSAAAYHFGSYR